MAQLFRELVEDDTCHTVSKLYDASIQELAARGLGVGLKYSDANCTMPQGNMLRRSANGLLIRSRKKVVLNPFLSGKALYDKVHKLVDQFSYGKRRS